jgi:hypothetical protein
MNCGAAVQEIFAPAIQEEDVEENQMELSTLIQSSVENSLLLIRSHSLMVGLKLGLNCLKEIGYGLPSG